MRCVLCTRPLQEVRVRGPEGAEITTTALEVAAASGYSATAGTDKWDKEVWGALQTAAAASRAAAAAIAAVSPLPPPLLSPLVVPTSTPHFPHFFESPIPPPFPIPISILIDTSRHTIPHAFHPPKPRLSPHLPRPAFPLCYRLSHHRTAFPHPHA